MNKPIWLLDVDGVLNALDKRSKDWPHYETPVCRGYVIRYAPALIERMDALVAADKVEIVWLTTWWDNIIHLPFTNWHGYRVANTEDEYNAFRKFSGSYDWWKRPVAQRLYTPGQKMIWTDDDLAFDRVSVEWVKSVYPDVLGISPNTNHGLTPAHLDTIEAFLG